LHGWRSLGGLSARRGSKGGGCGHRSNPPLTLWRKMCVDKRHRTAVKTGA
jgi:hypothetical protein